MPVTDTWADRLVMLAIDLRPHGAPRWDAAGIRAAIRHVQHLSLAEVSMAVIRGASDRTLETPAPIGNSKSPCWQERVGERPPAHPVKAEEACPTHPAGRLPRCSFCAADELGVDGPTPPPEPRPVERRVNLRALVEHYKHPADDTASTEGADA